MQPGRVALGVAESGRPTTRFSHADSLSWKLAELFVSDSLVCTVASLFNLLIELSAGCLLGSIRY